MSETPPPIHGPPPSRSGPPGRAPVPPGAAPGAPGQPPLRTVPGLANSPLMRREVSSPIIARMKASPQPTVSSPLASSQPGTTTAPVAATPPKFHAPPPPSTQDSTTTTTTATPPRFHAPPPPTADSSDSAAPTTGTPTHTMVVTPNPALLAANRAVSSPQVTPLRQQQQQQPRSEPVTPTPVTPAAIPTPTTPTTPAVTPMPRTLPRTVPVAPAASPVQPVVPRKPAVLTPAAAQPQPQPQPKPASPPAPVSPIAASVSPTTTTPAPTTTSPTSPQAAMVSPRATPPAARLSTPVATTAVQQPAGGAYRDAVTRTVCDYMIRELERGIRLQKTPEFTDMVCSISTDHTELIVTPLVFEGPAGTQQQQSQQQQTPATAAQSSAQTPSADESSQQSDGTMRNVAASTRYPIRAIDRVQDNRGPDGKLALSVLFRPTADLKLLPITFQSKDRMAFVNFIDGIGALLGYSPQTKERIADLKTIAEVFELTQQFGAPPVPPPPT